MCTEYSLLLSRPFLSPIISYKNKLTSRLKLITNDFVGINISKQIIDRYFKGFMLFINLQYAQRGIFQLKHSLSARTVYQFTLVFMTVMTFVLMPISNGQAAQPAGPGFELVQKSYAVGISSVVAITETRLASPLAIQVLNNGKPAPGERIDFIISDTPSGAKGTRLFTKQAVTDKEGISRCGFFVGSKGGKYLVTAYFNGSVRKAKPLNIRIQAMTSTWVMFLIFGLLGGLGLFLYGMNIASDNLQRVAGEQMRVLIAKLTRTRISAVLVGTAASGVLQSSSAATVMLVGFVSAGMMTLTQAIGVTIGSKVGVTITVQVIAFDISKYSLLVVGLGAIGIIFGGKKEKVKQISAIILGFGLIFFGLSIMSGSMKPLRGMPEVAALMITFSKNAALAMIAGVAVTAVIQSAAAMVAVCFVLASQGLLPLSAAIPLSIGGAVGTCATALLASLGSNKDGKRVAIAHLVFSVSAALVMYPFLGPFTDFTIWFTSLIGSESIIRQIANGFMLFSIITAIIFIPLIGVIEMITRRIIPASKKEEPFGPRYISETALQVPLMALSLAQKEVERMTEIFGDSLKQSIPALIDNDREKLGQLISESHKIDTLENAIRPFLARLSQKGLSRSDAALERTLIYITDHLKNAGRVLRRDILKTGVKLADSDKNLSSQGKSEIIDFHQKIVNKYQSVMETIHTHDRELAEQVLQLSFKETLLERKLRDSHLERLHAGKTKTMGSSADHLTILAGLNAIRENLDNTAREILQEL